MSILRCILIWLMMSLSLWVRADEPANANNDTIELPLKPFIRIGFDVSSVARQFIEPEVRQFEFTVDSEVKKNWFATLEGGFMNVLSDKASFEYKANGYFARAGMDYNLLGYADPVSQNDLVLLGVRYGYSYLQQEAPFFIIENPFWGEHQSSMESNSYHLHWIELSGGLKTELFRNFFLGWTLKTRIRLSDSSNPLMDPYYIAGFGHGKRSTPVMAQYFIFYRFGL